MVLRPSLSAGSSNGVAPEAKDPFGDGAPKNGSRTGGLLREASLDVDEVVRLLFPEGLSDESLERGSYDPAIT